MQENRRRKVSLKVSGRASINFQPGPTFEDRLFQAMMKSRKITYQRMLRKLLGKLTNRRHHYYVILLEKALVHLEVFSEKNNSLIIIHEIDGKSYTTHLVVSLEISADAKSVVVSSLAELQ